MTPAMRVQAYNHILNSDLLGARQRTVLRLLMEKGPMTGSEINRALYYSSGHKRLSELEKIGVIRAGAARLCKITQREAIQWEVTGHNPSALRKPSSDPSSSGAAPSRKTIEKSVKAIRSLIEFRQLQDPRYTVPQELHDTISWIKRKARM